MSSESTTIRWEQDDTGVVTLVLDDPNQSANTVNTAFRDSFAAITDRLEAEKDSVRASSSPPPRSPSSPAATCAT